MTISIPNINYNHLIVQKNYYYIIVIHKSDEIRIPLRIVIMSIHWSWYWKSNNTKSKNSELQISYEYGYFCQFETPELEDVGLVKYFGLSILVEEK